MGRDRELGDPPRSAERHDSGEGSLLEAPRPDPAPWGLSGALLLPVAAYLAQALLWLLLAAFARLVLAGMEPKLVLHEEELEALVLQATVMPAALAWSLLSVGLLYLSVTRACGRPFLAGLGIGRPSAAGAAGALAAGAALAWSYLVIAAFFPPDELQELGGPLTKLAESGPLGYTMWMLLAVVMAPIVEEMLFRGYAYQGARRAMAPVWAGALITVPFVLMHMAETGSYWPALAGITLVAVLLTVVMEKTGNLSYCIAAHLGYNGALALMEVVLGG